MARFNKKYIGISNLIISLTVIALLKGTKNKYFKEYLSKNEPKTMTKLGLRVEKYIDSKKALQVVDDLDLLDWGVIIKAKADPTLNLAQAKLSIRKRLVIEERDTKKKLRYDN